MKQNCRSLFSQTVVLLKMLTTRHKSDLSLSLQIIKTTIFSIPHPLNANKYLECSCIRILRYGRWIWCSLRPQTYCPFNNERKITFTNMQRQLLILWMSFQIGDDKKRLMIDIAATCQAYERRGISQIIWIEGKSNLVDAIEKSQYSNQALDDVLANNILLTKRRG